MESVRTNRTNRILQTDCIASRCLRLAVLLPGLIMCCLFLMGAGPANEKTITVGGITYSYVTSGSRATITDFQLNGKTTVNFPDKLNGYEVKYIELDDRFWERETHDYQKVREYRTSPGNIHFQAIDGVLYDVDGLRLRLYPSGREDTSFTVPDGVDGIYVRAFAGSHLSEIILPRSLTTIWAEAFRDCASLKQLTLPNQVSCMYWDAFAGCSALEYLFIPPNMDRFDDHSAVTAGPYDDFGLDHDVTTIRGVSGSPAEAWAAGAGLRFEPADYELYPVPFKVLKKPNIECGKEATFKVQTPVAWDCMSGNTDIARSDRTSLIRHGSWIWTDDGYTGYYWGRLKGVRCGKVQVTLTSYDDLVYRGATRKITFKVVPSQPVLSTKLSSRAARLTWTKSKGASQYLIYVRYPGKSKYKLALTKSSRVKSVLHRGLVSGKKYSYKVRSRRKVDGKWYYSAYSRAVSVKVK